MLRTISCFILYYFLLNHSICFIFLLQVVSKQRATIHPSSALHRTLPYCVLFTELLESNELYMKNVTVINSEWLAHFVPNYVAKKDLYNLPEDKNVDIS